MVDPTPKATPPSYLAELHPREWVERARDRWTLSDNQRDWGAAHHSIHRYWVATASPGNGRHEYLGTFKSADEAKAAVKARLAQ